MELHEPPVDILIVDDREDGLIALEAVLSSPEVNLVRASSGRQAVALAENKDFAVILLDVQMPVMDGFETAVQLRKMERSRHTPIIFVTAINKDDLYIFKGYEVGAVDYIFKPFEPHILRSKVNTFIDLFKKNRQLIAQAEIIRENERRDRYLKLAELEVESLKRYRNLADAIPHIVWKSRVDGTLDYFNKVWVDYTGMSIEESLGLGWQGALHPDDLDQFLKKWIHSMSRPRPFKAEVRLRRKDGELRWHVVSAVPELKFKNQIQSWIGTCTDIHDQKMAAERLIQAEQEAKTANIAKTQFLANMSHEIRTPLNAILGFAELILNPRQTEEEKIYSVSTIRRSGQQLLKIIDEILDISKVEAGHLEIETIEINLVNLLNEIKSLLSIQAEQKGLKIQFNLQSKIPEIIMTDPTRLRQILVNILGNAIKFTDKGEVRLDISVRKKGPEQKEFLAFRISDTGIGIESRNIEKLFHPFSQVDNSTTRKFGGTGLGLALSLQLAQALGGELRLANSKPGQGTTFVFEIPCVHAEQVAVVEKIDFSAIKDIKPFSERESKILSGVRVLLVDDAPDNQVLISRFLKSAGAEVDLASNGEEGVKKALEGQHKIVLMDIQMPQMDGYEATSRLRKIGYSKPIVALTAHAFKEERERCLKVGCTDHLTKPVDRRVLIDSVARIVYQDALGY